MACVSGPKTVNNGLLLCIDPFSLKTTKGLGTNSPSFNTFNDVLNSIAFTPSDGVFLTDRSYFTCVGLTYPESSQAAPWTSRNGITPGISNTTSTKVYSHSRDLGMFVWDDDTNTWVPDSYFRGERVSGHVYDTYDGLSGDGVSSEHTKFQEDYDAIKLAFPNATFIIIGSHAAEKNDDNAQTLARLQEIGLPDSHIGVARPEYVLIGKPNKPLTQTYVRENVDAAIGVLNVALPIYSSAVSNYRFDNSSYIDLPNSLGYTTQVSCFAWYKSNGTPAGGYHIICGGQELEISIPTAGQLRTGVTTSSRFVSNHGSGLTDGNWHYIGFTFDGTTKRSYIDGVDVGTLSVTGTLTSSFANRKIGQFGSNTTYYANGDLGLFHVYNRKLETSEVKLNYENTKHRYL